ncbi:hemoglobin subunit alpha-3-like [Spea bombifrons]|uniref:hemoglobin subunit alpha-3-like n=1 Tax=Spea bombifrons TaxID=233779 RepID=UPI00234B02A3|nr:hemoglobin subunit alpha-3-like [Spea bombifrons]
MSLSDSEKSGLEALWVKIAPEADNIGGEAMNSFLTSHPEAKTHFSHFDLTPKSADLLKHGGKIMNALGDAIKNVDNLPTSMASLTELHVDKLKVEPGNFKLLSEAIETALAARFPEDFTDANKAAWGKLLEKVSAVLSTKAA